MKNSTASKKILSYIGLFSVVFIWGFIGCLLEAEKVVFARDRHNENATRP